MLGQARLSVALALLVLIVTADNANALRFMVVGDWGANTVRGRLRQMEVAKSMETWCEENGLVDFILSTGDNFYPDGIKPEEEFRFDWSWKHVYDGKYLKTIPWYVSLGNRDHGKDERELVQVHHSDSDSRWRLPWLWHEFTRSVGPGMDAHILALDTVSLIEKKHDSRQQQLWLREQLMKPAKWKIVFGHHPAYSASKSGPQVFEIEEEVAKVLEAYNADIYFSGHDHVLQHIRKENGHGGVDYITSGTAGKKHHALDPLNESKLKNLGMEVEFFSRRYGFVLVSLGSSSMTVDFISARGKVIHSFKRKK